MAHLSFKALGFKVGVVADEQTFAVSLSDRGWRRVRGMLRGLLRLGRKADAKPFTPPPPSASETTPERQALLDRIEDVEWYHSIDLGHGVITPGFFDHRPILAHYQLPQRLDGLRVLDAATFDGFWAFEFERRGADEVVAIDIARRADLDMPPRRRTALTPDELDEKIGPGFQVAHEILQSKVRRELISLYDLSPEQVGRFDIVHSGDVLLHLTHPVRALQRLCSITKGYALISEHFLPNLDHLGYPGLLQYFGGIEECVWWGYGLNTLEQMIRDAGFDKVEILNTFRYGPRGEPALMHHVVVKAYPPP
ncbi:MAG: methyltransferase domain-containing protein [Phycisphaerae bacterium]